MSEASTRIGQKIYVPSKECYGVVAYVGSTTFSNGKWIGVVLEENKGKNNGTVQGKSYFQCEDGFGAFLRPSQITAVEGETGNKNPSASQTAGTPAGDRPKSSLRRAPIGNEVPQKPDRLRLLSNSTESISSDIQNNSGFFTPPDQSNCKLFRTPSAPKFGTSRLKTPNVFKTPKTTPILSRRATVIGERDIFKAFSETNLSRPKFVPKTSRFTPKYTPSSLVKATSQPNVNKWKSTENLMNIHCKDKQRSEKSSQDNIDSSTPPSSLPVVRYATKSSIIKPKVISKISSIEGKISQDVKDYSPRRLLKLPLGSVAKGTPQRGAAVEKPVKESPLQEMRKPASFVETNFVETLTPNFTPGASSTPMNTLEERAQAAQALQERDNLKAEIVDLNEKLETLRIKRAQDKEKLKEGEKLKLQLEQLMEFKSRIMDSQASLQKDLQKAKQEAKEAIEDKEKNVQETEEMMESVEMLTLDKEMAEEKAESLQLEMDMLKEKVEELTLDLEILKTEKNENEDEEIIVNKESSVQVKQLEQQSARLRETLVRMRDISAHDKHELQKAQKELDGRKSEVAELSRSKEKLAAQVSELETTIADLQEQVDAALGAEEMCEALTDRNLDLEEKVAELMETVSDLEAINDMNDQLQENARDVELELREEIDMTNTKIRELVKEREACQEVILDRDSTIKKFRDLVQKMQDQNLDLRHSLERETNKPMGTPSEIIDFKKMFTETKAQSKAIEMELRKLEVLQANQHVNYLTRYLPDAFLNRGGDHDAVLVMLLIPRLVCKAEIVINGLKDQFPAPEVIDRGTVLKSHTVDQFSFACRMLQMLYLLQAILKQYEHVLNSCNVEVFLKLGSFYPEMAAQEKNVDVYIDVMRKDMLDENISTEHLEKCVSYFMAVFPAHLLDQRLNQTSFLLDVSRSAQSATGALKTEASRIEALLTPSDSKNSDVSSLLNSLKSFSDQLEAAVKRVKRRLPQDGSAGPISYPDDVRASLTTAMSVMFNGTRCLRHVAKTCMQQTSLIGDTEGGITNDKAKEFIHQATDITYGKEDQGPDSIKMSVKSTVNELESIATTLEKGEYDFDGTQEKENVPPLFLRAEMIENELQDLDRIKYKLESKEQDIKDMKLLLKQKNEEHSEMTVRRDMAEKKLSNATRDADATIEKLQRKLDDTLMALRRKEKDFEETMDQLQSDIESLELEKGELREKLKTTNKRSLYESINRSVMHGTGIGSPTSSPTSPSMVSIPATSGVMVKDSPMLLQQISDLKTAYKQATFARRSDEVQDMQKKLAALRPLKVVTSGMYPKVSSEEKRDLSKEEASKTSLKIDSRRRINELLQQVNLLQKEIMATILSTEVVNLGKTSSGLEPVRKIMNHDNKLQNLKNKITELQDEVARLVAERTPGGKADSAFASFPSNQLVKAVGEKEPILIGRITVPGTSVPDSSEAVKLVLGPEELLKLHRSIL